MSNVLNFKGMSTELDELKQQTHRNEFDGGGGGGYDGGMEKRVEKLEADLAAMKVDLAVIKSNYATSTDIAKLGAAMQSEINAQTWKLIIWVCSFGTALVGATYFIAKHV